MSSTKAKRRNRIFVIGAGFAGTSIAREIRQKGMLGDVTAFLDDDRQKIGTRIDGVPVLGPVEDVVSLLQKSPGDEALIAIPSATRERLKHLYGVLERAQFAKIRILPSISQILDGDAHLIQTRDIDPQDLLGRTPVRIGLRESLAYLRGKRVLITGAGGSIGGELARQLLSGGASRLYLFGHGENSIYEIDRELRLLQEEGVGEKATIIPVIGELQDRDYMHFLLGRLKADVVFHTAAHKHVPLTEENPVGAILNNVFGTRNVVDAAAEAGVKRFVLISTDKVVEPASVYGASKRIAEEIVLDRAGEGRDFMVVRFGNVLASRGSIIPLFRNQILKGGPVTITDPDASRYFMTIPEASSLVLKAGGVGVGGTLYLLDMGEPIRIRELAEHMVRFYGFQPGDEIPFQYVGLRPGEKKCESLVGPDETPFDTEYPRIKRVKRNGSAAELRRNLTTIIRELTPVCAFDASQPDLFRNRRELRRILKSYIPTLLVPENEPAY